MNTKSLNMIRDRLQKLAGGDYDFVVTFDADEDTIEVEANKYFQYQDKGVSGKKKTVPGSPYKYGKHQPPASAFARYTTDKKHQWAISGKIFRDGIEPKHLMEKFNNDPVLAKIITGIYMGLTKARFKDTLKANGINVTR